MAKEKYRFEFDSGVVFEEGENKKIKCGRCGAQFTRIISHLQKNSHCCDDLDIDVLKVDLNKYQRRESQKLYVEKAKREDKERFLENQREWQRKYCEKAREQNEERFLKGRRERQRRYWERAKDEDEETFLERQRERQRRYCEKSKAEDEDKFLENQRQRQKRYSDKARAEDKDSFLEKQRQRQRRYYYKKKYCGGEAGEEAYGFFPGGLDPPSDTMSEDQGYPDPLPGSSQPFPVTGQSPFGDFSEFARNMMANPAVAEMYKNAWAQQSNYMALMLQQQQQQTASGNSGKVAGPPQIPDISMMPMMDPSKMTFPIANPMAMMNMMQVAMASAAYMGMGSKEIKKKGLDAKTAAAKDGQDEVKRQAGKDVMAEKRPTHGEGERSHELATKDENQNMEENQHIENLNREVSQHAVAMANGIASSPDEGADGSTSIHPEGVQKDTQDSMNPTDKTAARDYNSKSVNSLSVKKEDCGGRANRRKPKRPTQIYCAAEYEEGEEQDSEMYATLDGMSNNADLMEEYLEECKPSPEELERLKALYAETGSIHSDVTDKGWGANSCQKILKRPPKMRQDILSEDSNDSQAPRKKYARFERPVLPPPRRKKPGPGGKYRSYLAKASSSNLYSCHISNDNRDGDEQPDFKELQKRLNMGSMLPDMTNFSAGSHTTVDGPSIVPEGQMSLPFTNQFGDGSMSLPELAKLSAMGDLSDPGFKSESNDTRAVTAEAFPVVYRQFHEPFSFYGMRRIYDPYEGLNERSRIHAEVLSDCSVQVCHIRTNGGDELLHGDLYPVGEDPSGCSECLKCSTAAPHTYSNLAEIGPFWCHVCGESFNRKGELFNHLSVHTHPDEDFLCEECGKAFDSRAGLSLHSRVHTIAMQPAGAEDAPKFFVKTTKNPEDGAFWFKCPVCERKFPDKPQIAEHLWEHKWDKPYECDECDKRFASKFELKQHQLIHRSKQFQCPVCGKEYRRKFDMLTHMRYHTEDRYECKVCKERFAERWIFLEHSKIHSGNNPYECQICGSVFTRQSSLRDHQIIHSDERPHKCEVCQKSFKMKDHLRQHFRMHTGERKYKCEQCSETFVRQFLLTEHMRIHTGEKPFSCSVCHMLFRRNLDRRAHEVRYHNGQVEGFPCLECGKLFVIKSKLQKHMNTVHSDQRPYNCELCTNTYKWKKSLMQHVAKVHVDSERGVPQPGRRGRPPGRPKVFGAPLPPPADFQLKDTSVLKSDSELHHMACLPGMGIKDPAGYMSTKPSSALGAPEDEEDEEVSDEGEAQEEEDSIAEADQPTDAGASGHDDDDDEDDEVSPRIPISEAPAGQVLNPRRPDADVS